MRFYLCSIHDDMYYNGCTLHTLSDRILIRFFFKKWIIPHEMITRIHLKNLNIGVEYTNRTGTNYIEILTFLSLCNERLERELESIGKPVQYH